jgi:hypothetical protein
MKFTTFSRTGAMVLPTVMFACDVYIFAPRGDRGQRQVDWQEFIRRRRG